MKSQSSFHAPKSNEKDSKSLLEKFSGNKQRFRFGCAIVSLGILITSSGGSWDITNHLLNKPETFFSLPHLFLYTGVAVSVVGAAVMFIRNRVIFNQPRFKLSKKLVLIGLLMVIFAAPFDYNWHLAFGLDGLLSPSHFTLTFGLFLASIGALTGIAVIQDQPPNKNGNQLAKQREPKRQSTKKSKATLADCFLSVLGLLPVWLTATGLLYMFSLPFSDTEFFDFNPEPTFAVIFATLSYPLLISSILFLSYRLNNRFGVLSITGISFLFINAMTSIFTNDFLVTTIPFYLVSIIPFIIADTILSFSKRKILQFVAGAILGSTAFMVYYPLITYVYNGVFTQKVVFPSLIAHVYSELMVSVYPLLAGIMIVVGVMGAALGGYILSHGDAVKQVVGVKAKPQS